MVREKDLAFVSSPTEPATLGSGLMTKCMDKGNYYRQKAVAMKVHFSMDIDKELEENSMEIFWGSRFIVHKGTTTQVQVIANTKVIGCGTTGMAPESTCVVMGACTKGNSNGAKSMGTEAKNIYERVMLAIRTVSA